MKEHVKEEFFSHISHDIRTPLNVIMGFAALARDEINNPDKIVEYLDQIYSSGQFLMGLIDDMLDISTLETRNFEFKYEPYSIAEFLDFIKMMASPLAMMKNIDLEIDADGKACFMADKLRFNQIFMGLVENAIKYTPDGGKVSCKVHTYTDNGKLRIVVTVTDNGIGMSRDFIQKMYAPFAQENASVQRAKERTGLGLTITKKLVDLMGGTIEVESNQGVGTCFTVNIEAAPAINVPVAYENCNLVGYRILVCEDHPINRKIVKTLLEKRGATVILASNGLEGVINFEASGLNEISCILMDLRMPVMDGIKATMKIRALDRADAHSVPIIALTADTLMRDENDARVAGMNMYLTKPASAEVLYKAIDEVMKK